MVTDPLARILEANRAAAALFEAEREFLTGKPLAAYVASGDRWGFRTMVNRLQRGDEERVSDRALRFRRRGGEILTVAATVEPVLDEGEPATLRWLLRRPGPDELLRRPSRPTTPWPRTPPAAATWRPWRTWTWPPTSMGPCRCSWTRACGCSGSTGSA